MASGELKLYRGYANSRELVVSGHAFRKYPVSQNLYSRSGFKNIRSILELFTVKTLPNIKVIFEYGTIRSEMHTESDGFFRFRLELTEPLPPGWHTYRVTLDDVRDSKRYHLIREGEFLVPRDGSRIIISDIDDTFLVSHSLRPLKKLYVLLSRNVERRKPYEDVCTHYQMLENGKAGGPDEIQNPFFFVSSSEWNLYDYIIRFAALRGLPKAVIKLKKIKDNLEDFLMTGRGSHSHKQRKIENILQFYPGWKFILLGDDSQQDPYIYNAIAADFPGAVIAVYIRQTKSRPRPIVQALLQALSEHDIAVCYFRTSGEAIRHSIAHGFAAPPVV